MGERSGEASWEGIPSLYLAETMDIILFPIISLEGVSTKWLRYVEVEILAPSLYK